MVVGGGWLVGGGGWVGVPDTFSAPRVFLGGRCKIIVCMGLIEFENVHFCMHPKAFGPHKPSSTPACKSPRMGRQTRLAVETVGWVGGWVGGVWWVVMAQSFRFLNLSHGRSRRHRPLIPACHRLTSTTGSRVIPKPVCSTGPRPSQSARPALAPFPRPHAGLL